MFQGTPVQLAREIELIVAGVCHCLDCWERFDGGALQRDNVTREEILAIRERIAKLLPILELILMQGGNEQ